MTRSDTPLEERFLEELAHELAEANIPVKRRETMLTELDELMSEGIRPESFGSPASLAQEISDALARSEDAQRATIWSPDIPKLFAGKQRSSRCSILQLNSTDLNLGAIAVKLGLLREDDVDPAVLDAIPQRVIGALRWGPFALTAATAAVGMLVHRRRLRIPTRIGFSGKVKKTWPSKAGGLAITGLSSLLSLLSLVAPTSSRANLLVQSSQALAANTAFLLTAGSSFALKKGRVHPLYFPMSIGFVLAVEGGTLLFATRTGLARVHGRVHGQFEEKQDG